MIEFLTVGMGGALGAMGRYAISLIPVKTSFPVLTLVTNLLGAVLIGVTVGYFSGRGSGERMLLFWKTGVCGGFTTFSTFSLEALRLMEKGDYLWGGLYIALSFFLCILGVAVGQYLGSRLVRA